MRDGGLRYTLGFSFNCFFIPLRSLLLTALLPKGRACFHHPVLESDFFDAYIGFLMVLVYLGIHAVVYSRLTGVKSGYTVQLSTLKAQNKQLLTFSVRRNLRVL